MSLQSFQFKVGWEFIWEICGPEIFSATRLVQIYGLRGSESASQMQSRAYDESCLNSLRTNLDPFSGGVTQAASSIHLHNPLSATSLAELRYYRINCFISYDDITLNGSFDWFRTVWYKMNEWYKWSSKTLNFRHLRHSTDARFYPHPMPLSETIISITPQQRELLPRTESINELTIASSHRMNY
jgi:hypothetical protein